MNLIQHYFLAFGLSALASMLVIAADADKAPVIVASPATALNKSHHGDVAYSPDGKYITYIPREQGPKIHLLDTTTNKVLQRIPRGRGTFTPDSTRIVFIYPVENWEPFEEKPPYKDDIFERIKVPSHRVDVYDVKTGRSLHRITLRRGQPFGSFPNGRILTFAVSDTCVVVAAKDAVATIYDLETGKAVGDVPGKLRSPNRFALSKDGRWLLTLDAKRTLRTWDLKTRKRDRVLYEHMQDVSGIAISADGRYCCSATKRGLAFVFDRTTGEQKAFIDLDTNTVEGIAFTSDGKRVVAKIHPRGFFWRIAKMPVRPAELDSGLRLWDWQTKGPPTTVMIPWTTKGEADRMGKGSFTPDVMTGDGNRFLSTGGNAGIMLLDLKAPVPKPVPKPEPGAP